ncbi:hypothetical protein [Clostridium neonatale]|uniref:hypothetical protein n=1 Tax=Clostridium neonatale TaxID=137838 RepID=UPI00291B5AF5|nr:hypothetical protein [Clostridium neonatale]CAI3654162.1 hypothetical protein CNEO4_2150001 [Clostridium neonatale]CAI3657102.1 hypothetical protein CNEO4_2370002 [Clostridium neonatale]
MYHFKDTKIKRVEAYGILCRVYFIISLTASNSIKNLLFVDYQWMMIVALSFMLCYNCRKCF